MSLSVGKIRGLQQLSDNGIFKIVAIDHRDVFVDMLRESNKSCDSESVIEEKLEVIRLTNKHVSGYLVDPQYALPMCIFKQTIPGKLGFMVSYEDNDYDVKNFNEDYFFKGLSVKKISEMRASAVKVFLNFNPRSSYCTKQEEIIAALAEECKKISIPLLLEPVIYSLNQEDYQPEEKVGFLFETLDMLSKYEVDVFKIQFPGEINKLSHNRNLEICRMVTERLRVPWVIMSSGVDIDSFTCQLSMACESGASGFVIGRTLWKEFITAKGMREEESVQIKQRIEALNKIVERKAKRWTSIDGLINFNFDQSIWLMEGSS